MHWPHRFEGLVAVVHLKKKQEWGPRTARRFSVTCFWDFSTSTTPTLSRSTDTEKTGKPHVSGGLGAYASFAVVEVRHLFFRSGVDRRALILTFRPPLQESTDSLEIPSMLLLGTFTFTAAVGTTWMGWDRRGEGNVFAEGIRAQGNFVACAKRRVGLA